MKLIIGLGNPDKEYENTFHNLGFMAVDKCAQKLGIDVKKQKCEALIGDKNICGEKVIIAKPLTYMNLSGESVRELVSFYKISLDDILVIYDDYDLSMGEIRIRKSGSAGTHNGMRNIVKELGSGSFKRVRIGFKPQTESKIPLLNLVLSGINKEDRPVFDKAIEIASQVASDFAYDIDFEKIMQKFNGKID